MFPFSEGDGSGDARNAAAANDTVGQRQAGGEVDAVSVGHFVHPVMRHGARRNEY
jgi:hypothetical protein